MSGDTLLRMIRSAPVPGFVAPTIVGIDDWVRGDNYDGRLSGDYDGR
ncbi:hypothetical protein [Sphingobium sp. KCTC 72723]